MMSTERDMGSWLVSRHNIISDVFLRPTIQLPRKLSNKMALNGGSGAQPPGFKAWLSPIY